MGLRLALWADHPAALFPRDRWATRCGAAVRGDLLDTAAHLRRHHLAAGVGALLARAGHLAAYVRGALNDCVAHGFAASCGAGWVTGFASSYCRAPGECPVWKPPVVPHPAGVECKKLELSTLGIPLALYNTKKQSLQLRSGEIPKDEFAG